MKVLVTAGTAGIGKVLVDHFAPLSMGFGRRNGYDIRQESIRKDIAKLSLDFDVFINHAYTRDESQNLLLREVADLWIEQEKTGYIFNTGTFGTFRPDGIDADYIDIKSKLDEIHHQYVQRINQGELTFRMTLLRPGMLDTERSRSKPHWRGNGIRGTDIAQLIQAFYNLPSDLNIADVVMESAAP